MWFQESRIATLQSALAKAEKEQLIAGDSIITEAKTLLSGMMKEELKAAIRIQSSYRGCMARKPEVLERARAVKLVSIMQRRWRNRRRLQVEASWRSVAHSAVEDGQGRASGRRLHPASFILHGRTARRVLLPTSCILLPTS